MYYYFHSTLPTWLRPDISAIKTFDTICSPQKNPMVGGCITSALLLLGGGQPELRSRSIRNCRVIGRSARGWNDVNAFVVIGVGAAQVEVGRLSTLEAEETMRQVVRGKSCQLKV